MEQNISIKQILVDLISIWPQISKQYKNTPTYSELMEFLSLENYYKDEDIPYPTLKQIEENTNLNSYQIRKQLKNIYDEIFDYPHVNTLKFDRVEIFIRAEYFKNYASFKVENLKCIPRIGEHIHLPFVEAKIGFKLFYVQDIKHELTGNKQRITISVKGGFFNSYWYYRKHKAIELGEIGQLEEFNSYDFEIKKKLGLNY